jgi:hypothetical protein
MKVTDLLLEGSDLSFDGDLKRVMGDTRAWLEKAGIGPHDVRAAMLKIKELPEFEHIAEKVKYISTAKQESNGSLVFSAEDWIAHVSAMGQIRFASPSGWRRNAMNTFTRLASPKPGLVHGNPVASLVKTMKAALISLAKKPKMAKALREAGKPIKESADVSAQVVLDRLLNTSEVDVSAEDKKLMLSDIERKQQEGWLVDEIIAHMRNMEELQPDLDEDKALARMRAVNDRVKARLAGLKEELDPKTEGWYIKQTVNKVSKWLAGPMSEDMADKEVTRRGGADKYISKAFVSRIALQKKKDAELE